MMKESRQRMASVPADGSNKGRPAMTELDILRLAGLPGTACGREEHETGCLATRTPAICTAN